MATSSNKLFIPRKGIKLPSLPVSTQDHDTNMRAIERYVNNLAPGGVTQLVAGTNITLTPSDGLGVVTIASSGSGGTFYASLTGTGETASPGDLTQEGGLIVNDSEGHGITLGSSGGEISITNNAQLNVFSSDSASFGGGGFSWNMTSGVGAAATLTYSGFNINISMTSTAITLASSDYPVDGVALIVNTAGEFVSIAGSAAGTIFEAKQAGSVPRVGFYGATPVSQASAPTTLAQVITLLTNLGLCA